VFLRCTHAAFDTLFAFGCNQLNIDPALGCSAKYLFVFKFQQKLLNSFLQMIPDAILHH